MASQRLYLEHGFGPFFDSDSRLLILGSFPSVKSREAQFFYGHPQNRFWRILAAVFSDEVPVTLDEKKAFLTRRHIALYDVIEACSVVGSSDSSIEDVIPADLRPILEGCKVGTRIYTNGGTAYALYMKHILPVLGIPAVRLPSSSPANAAWSLQRLTEAWAEALIPKGDCL